MELLHSLNPEQKAAVEHGQGPLLIIAGAGTGKTKIITHRIAYLISSKMARPEEIMAVTFTEKAANEMEERIDLLVPYGYSFVEIGTFNSFGDRVLRNYAHELGLVLDFILLDDVSQAIFFREHLFQMPMKYYRPLGTPTRHIQELLGAVRGLKQEGISEEDYLRYARRLKTGAKIPSERETALKHQEIALIYKKYQRLLRSQGKIDFEDQIALTVKLFQSRPSVLSEFQNRYKYILVDEFQDTNYIQFEMLKLLAASHRNITVVGDDDQSIFRFRGASLSNILNFRNMYPDAKSIVINKNYRSTQSILDSAYRLIQHNNPNRLEISENIDKSLKSMQPDQARGVRMLQFDTLSHESDSVAVRIQELASGDRHFRDIAILVRRNADADPFLRALNMKGIPFRFSGSRGLYSQTEIKILVAFLRSISDFQDSRSLFYLALSEIYRIPPYDLTVLSNFAKKKNLSLHAVFRMLGKKDPIQLISQEVSEKVKSLFQDLLEYVRLAAAKNAGRVLFTFLEKSGYLKNLAEKKTTEAELVIKNIRIFFDKVKNFSNLTEDDSVWAFTRYLDLLQDVGDNPATAEAEREQDAVHVLTVHKSKGLEFPVVFMVGLTADRYPGSERKEKIPPPEDLIKEHLSPGGEANGADRSVSHVQEERRLFYVGMTRAKENLYLTWSRDYGLKRLKKVSPFVLEALDLSRIPEETLHTSALEEIGRFAPPAAASAAQPVPTKLDGIVTLSFFQVDDFLTCPMKYRYRHIIRVPVVPGYNVTYGRVLHDVIHHYLKKKAAGHAVPLDMLLKEYESRWINEGFLSREHEEMKKRLGEEALRRFHEYEENSTARILYLEKAFKWQHRNVRFVGRWDRIDETSDGVVIIDFKASQVKDQKEADKKAHESLQMDLYALSFFKSHPGRTARVRMVFLESGIFGNAEKGPGKFERAEENIMKVSEGIRSQNFTATPGWHQCSYCDFKAICPSSFAY